MVDAVVQKNANFPLITWSNTSHTDEKGKLDSEGPPPAPIIWTSLILLVYLKVMNIYLGIGPSNWQNNSLPALQTPTALGTPSRPTEDLSAPAASQTSQISQATQGKWRFINIKAWKLIHFFVKGQPRASPLKNITYTGSRLTTCQQLRTSEPAALSPAM